ncbi:2-C-methyl-D-erythritol 4-phosphate cytidylyltransferase [Corynebacterium argentoratense]|uniref:2-C-methyl-D-erythritol 4-phosphate cytidylyltransferase n=1 Tax=Corynebacterium argentoratense TaxID=42817 RepID=UPI002E14473A|nr:2-C-methyl-D-erythritol 4-phosphate cytidylyltransferase [Corynebacterium argentoratense]
MCIRRVAAVIVAAGSGTRLGANKPKALVELGGRCLLDRACGVRCCWGGVMWLSRCRRICVMTPRWLRWEASLGCV